MGSVVLRQIHALFGLFCILFSYGYVTGLLSIQLDHDNGDAPLDTSFIWKYLVTYFPFAAPISSVTSLFISQLVTGIVSDRFGRRPVLAFSILPLVISCVLLSFTKSWMSFLIAYFIAGFSSGGLTTSFVLVTETCSPKYRVTCINFLPVFYTIGLATPYYLGVANGWKLLYLYGVVSTACAFLMALTLPESHYWLARKGKLSECKYSFSWYRGDDLWELEEILDDEVVKMKLITCNQLSQNQLSFSSDKNHSFLNKEFIMSLSVSLSCVVFILSTSRMTFFSFSLQAFEALHLHLDDLQYEILLLFLSIYLIFSFILNYVRLRLVVIITGVLSLSIFLLSSYYLSCGFTPYFLSIKITLVLLYLFLIVIVLVPSLMTILLIVLPTLNRNLGVSLVSLVLVISVKCLMYMSLDLLKHISIELGNALNLLIVILSLCHLYYCMPEQYCKTVGEIENEMKKNRRNKKIFQYSQIVIDEKLTACPFSVSPIIINDV